MMTTLQNEADCCRPLNSVIAAEPLIIMDSVEELDLLRRELDSLEADSVTTTAPDEDKNIIRYQLGPYPTQEKQATTTSYGDTYSIHFDLKGPEKNERKKSGDYEPDYVEGQLDRFAPGTYVEVTRLNPVYMEDGLFGFTWLGTNKAFVRGDLKGKVLELVRDHEVRGHQILGLAEDATRDLTGTHMPHFLDLYNRMKARNY